MKSKMTESTAKTIRQSLRCIRIPCHWFRASERKIPVAKARKPNPTETLFYLMLDSVF